MEIKEGIFFLNELDFANAEFISYYNRESASVEVFLENEPHDIAKESRYIRLPSKAPSFWIRRIFFSSIQDDNDYDVLERASRRPGFFRKIKELGYDSLYADIEQVQNEIILKNWCQANGISFI